MQYTQPDSLAFSSHISLIEIRKAWAHGELGKLQEGGDGDESMEPEEDAEDGGHLQAETQLPAEPSISAVITSGKQNDSPANTHSGTAHLLPLSPPLLLLWNWPWMVLRG